MNLLLDTHVVLWWLDDALTLSSRARAAITAAENLVFVSAASVWEIRIKHALGKLVIPANFKDVLAAQPFFFLDITPEHAHAVSDLPPVHRDPFDRMLIAQARTQGLTLVTRDARFKDYELPLLDA